MPRNTTASGFEAAGRDEHDGIANSVARAGATEDQVVALAACADWRAAVQGLALSQRDARELRIRILRERTWPSRRRRAKGRG